MQKRELIRKLTQLLPSQFEELLFRLDVPSSISPSPMMPQIQRASELVRLVKSNALLSKLEAFLNEIDKKAPQSIVSPEKEVILSSGSEIGKYKLEALIAKGGFSEVWRARDDRGQLVALKVAKAPDALQSAILRRELQLLQSGKLQGVSAPIDMFSEGDKLYTVSEFHQGTSLNLWQAERRTLSQILLLYARIAEITDNLHSEGIIHRDLSPMNILVRPDSSPVIIDLGLAQRIERPDFLTSQRFFIGTASYVPAETFRGEPQLTTSSDIYSLGVMLYSALFGKLPRNIDDNQQDFVRMSMLGEFSEQFYDQIFLLRPLGLSDLIRSMLSYVPAQRPSSATVKQNLLEAIEKIEKIKNANLWIVPFDQATKNYLHSLLDIQIPDNRDQIRQSNHGSAELFERIATIERHLEKTARLTESLAIELQGLGSLKEEQLERVIRRSLVLALSELKMENPTSTPNVDKAVEFIASLTTKISTTSIEPEHVHVAILIALDEEFDQFLELIPQDYKAIRDEKYGGHDFTVQIPSARSMGYRCVARLIGSMGPETARGVAERLLDRWKPQVAVMLGIAASLDSDIKLGDVVVATQIDAYATTLKAKQNSSGFYLQHRGTVYSGDHVFLEVLKDLKHVHKQLFSDWQTRCYQELETILKLEHKAILNLKGLPDDLPKLHRVHLASGPVVGAAEAYTEWLQTRDGTIKALEMEAAGLAAAAHARRQPIRTLILRGISDFGDQRKTELDKLARGGVRKYAMRNAVRLFLALLQENLL